MRTWSFYHLITGEFTGRRYSASSDKDLEKNTPSGCGAIDGVFDRFSQRYDARRDAVIDHVASDLIARTKGREKSIEARDLINRLEARQHRRVRELLSKDDEQLAAIDAQIAELRADLIVSEKETSEPEGGSGSIRGPR